MIYKERLERDNYYKFKKFNFILVIVCTFCLGYFSYPLLNKTNEVKVYNLEQEKESYINIPLEAETTSFSVDSLKAFITALNIKHPDIVFAQAVCETGHFTSNIFNQNNNLFGMKMAYRRPKTAIGIKNGHAEYNNWKESVIDYALWQNRYANFSNKDDYFKYLSKNYAEDKTYVQKLKSIIRKNE
jgi:flagellum-specific peptidoglycan hydrolase FlgJ